MTILALTLCCFYVMLLYVVARWMLRPLDEAAKARHRPTQFTIVDFLCLFVLVQISTAMIHGYIARFSFPQSPTARVVFILDGYAWLSIGLIWWKCIQIMSRAGVHRPRHRVVLLLFVLPAALLSLIFSPFLPVSLWMILLHLLAPSKMAAGTFWPPWLLLGLSIVLSLTIWLCAFLVRRIVAQSEAELAATAETPQDGGLSPEPIEPQ